MASRRAAAGSRAGERRVAALTALRAQLRIELRGVKPQVWRCILVPETITLAKLHVVLQWTMGWTNSHLHEYEIARRRYGVPDREWPEEVPLTDERRVRLNSFIEAGRAALHLPLRLRRLLGARREDRRPRRSSTRPTAHLLLGWRQRVSAGRRRRTTCLRRFPRNPRPFPPRRACRHAAVGGRLVRPGGVRPRGDESTVKND